MRLHINLNLIGALAIALALTAGIGSRAYAEVADLADVPLANAPSDTVLPNLMYTLDDSYSMSWDFMPDNVLNGPGSGGAKLNCKTCSGGSCTTAGAICSDSTAYPFMFPGKSTWGEPPYYSAQFNQVYYNPDVSYSPAVTSTGTSYGNASPTAAPDDAFLDTTPKDLTTAYAEIYYCTTSTPTAAQLTNTAVCRRNGINNVSGLGYFLYWSNDATNGGYPLTTFPNQVVKYTGHPYYFKISPHEYCSDANLINCTLSGTPTGSFTFPAPIRYCSSTANAASTAVMSDAASSTTPKCRKQFDTSTYIYPRYGRFTRVDILASTPTYNKGPNAVRPDCVSTTSCTYTEELQNFANWYSYYRTRMLMMKTASGQAFIPIDDRYRVGFITINPGSPVNANQYEAIRTFDTTQRALFYGKMYNQDFRSGTPLRQALSRVGRHYAGVATGINNGMPEDPIQYSCQQNFALLTTDGYWNDSGTVAIQPNNSAVGNQDNVPDAVDPIYVSRPTVTLDGEGTQTQDVTPRTVLDQALCTSNAAVLGTTCGCGANFKRIKQRTQNQQTTTDKTDGAITSGPTLTTTSTTYQDITACNATVQTRTIVTRQTMRQSCSGNAVINFGDAYGSVACGCVGTNKRMKQRVVDLTRVIVTTDGVVTSDTTTGAGQVYSNVVGVPPGGTALGNCVASGSPALTPGPTLISNLTLSDNTTTTGSTITAANITIAPNPKTTVGTTTTTVTAYGGAANTLADVAMWYYKNDLRTGAPLAKSDNNFKTNSKDINPGQHMITFGLGLGLKGNMDYTPDYESNSNSDFAKIRSSATTCPWTPVAGRTCNWPLPTSSSPSTLDDLWHAAVNGRGAFYSASDPNTLADGLAGALSALKIQTAAASASATSSPNITQTENYIYSSTFRTVKWDGEIVAQRVDDQDGTVLPTIVWSAQAQLDLKVATAEAAATPSDGRTIKTFMKTAPGKLKDFAWASLTAAEQAYFTNKCTALSQCPLLTVAQQADANNGQLMVEYLRGRRNHEGTAFRVRDHRLGDPVNATPAYVKDPRFNFADAVTPSYSTFKSANASRQGVLYIAANDGMLHALNGDTGDEMWAYVPRIVFPNLHKIATDNWDVRHEYSVDGSPQVMDAYDTGAGAWKTILIAGLNKGGHGYYALDITNPSSPKGLWEACADSTLCAVSNPDFGFSYGYPVITKRAFDGKWVVLVTSGMNNVAGGATGHGYLFVLDAFTGAILQKVDTGAGDTTTPSGFAKISAFANNFNTDNTATFVYGGDLLGNLWRFDMSTNPPTVLLLAQLTDGSGKQQSITSRPELGVVDGNRVVYVGTGRYLGEDDLPDPATLTPPLTWAYQQSFYAIKDNNVAHGNIRTSTPGLVQQTITSVSTTTRSTSANTVDWTLKDGWFVDFNPGNASPGERVNLDPQLVLGTVAVATNVPNNTACSIGGDSWLYQFDYRSGKYVSSSTGNLVAEKLTGQTLVGVVVVRLPSGVLKAIATGSTGEKRTIGVNIGGGGGSGRRVSWRELIQ
jgi:Tfp pilus tip-associated adhesin PilY1